jgi:hypothetical protein
MYVKFNLSVLSLFVGLTISQYSLANSSLCRTLQSNKTTVINQINSSMAGSTWKVTKRKKLRLVRAETLTRTRSRGRYCRIRVKVRVKLLRKIRRDATGIATVRGDVILATRAGQLRACVHDSKVVKLDLGRTLRVGEAMYRWIAKKTLPRQMCFAIDISRLRK